MKIIKNEGRNKVVNVWPRVNTRTNFTMKEINHACSINRKKNYINNLSKKITSDYFLHVKKKTNMNDDKNDRGNS